MKYNAYVISLIDEYERRSSVKKQLTSLVPTFKYVDAIDFRAASVDLLIENTAVDKLGSLNRMLTKGEVGCALSHFKCYQEIVSDDSDWAWVIEDDADLSRLTNDSVEKIISLVAENNIDVVILGYSKLSKNEELDFYKFEPIRKLFASEHFALGEPWKNWTCGTVSYLISKSGAKKMLDYFSDGKVITVADDWMFFEKNIGLNITHLRPLLVFEDFISFQSALEIERAAVSKNKIAIMKSIKVLRGYFRALLMKTVL